MLHVAPDVLASETHAANLLHLAAINGRAAVVELLSDNGVDVNKPSPIEPMILVTPLCAARLKRHKDVETLLLQRGAADDIFTHACLGDVKSLAEDLDRDSDLTQEVDPAVDALVITPVHHAVAGENAEALRLLLSRTSTPILNGSRALRLRVSRQNVPLVRMLLDAGRGCGRGWRRSLVLHPELAPLLAGAEAKVDRSGAWIGLACTGNQRRKDDPEYVAALLRHGARVDDRREVGQDNDGGRATAVHYAAKAGFLETINLLLAQGADSSAKDANASRRKIGCSDRQNQSRAEPDDTTHHSPW